MHVILYLLEFCACGNYDYIIKLTLLTPCVYIHTKVTSNNFTTEICINVQLQKSFSGYGLLILDMILQNRLLQ